MLYIVNFVRYILNTFQEVTPTPSSNMLSYWQVSFLTLYVKSIDNDWDKTRNFGILDRSGTIQKVKCFISTIATNLNIKTSVSIMQICHQQTKLQNALHIIHR
jgi:hypothetical protein